ncbi:MAG: large subunit ribosomal protein [Patescibacteria group bacterium]|nr:large subunit ribosomal protein [Patescibacteria group bacterium]
MDPNKKVTKKVKVQIMAGKAVPAPPLGPALGQAGVNIADFTKRFNDATKDMKGLLSVKIYAYEDRTYDFVAKTATTTSMIKEVLGMKSGSNKPGIQKAGKITKAQIRAIAEHKLNDLTANTIEEAEKIIAGAARSMGLEVSN